MTTRLVAALPVVHAAAAPSLVAEDATDSAPASAVGAAIAGPVFDPTALPIADRVRLLRHRIAARQRGDIGAGGSSANGTRTVGSAGSRLALSAAELGGHVLSACTAAGVGAEAAPVVLQQVVRSKVASHPDTLLPFLRSLHSLSQRYGETVVLEWLRRAPPIIRAEAEVTNTADHPRECLLLLLLILPYATAAAAAAAPAYEWILCAPGNCCTLPLLLRCPVCLHRCPRAWHAWPRCSAM